MKAQGSSDQEILDIVQAFGRTHGEPMEREKLPGIHPLSD